MIVRFYNGISGKDVENVDEIPSDALLLISAMEYNVIVRTLIVRDLRNGAKVWQCKERYKISRNAVRRIRDRYKL